MFVAALLALYGLVGFMTLWLIRERRRNPGVSLMEGETFWHPLGVLLVVFAASWLLTAEKIGVDAKGPYMMRSSHSDCFGPRCAMKPEVFHIIRIADIVKWPL